VARKHPRSVQVYSVGGAVRDELLGRPVADHDWVVVGATPEMMLASGYTPVGRDFPVFLHPDTHEEHALARTERKHGTGYRGFEFFASPDVTLEEDLARRDLTINAMARDAAGALIDPYGGEHDLRAGVLRHVSPAFAEDPLRVLRVARFAARFDFTVAPATMALMRRIVAAGELTTLASERVWQELAKGLDEPRPSRMLAVLRTSGALAVLLPEVDALYDTALPRARGGNAGRHVARAVDYAAAHRYDLPARYATLAQDLGGDATPARVNVRRADALSSRLRVPVDCRDAARLSARHVRDVERAERLQPAQLLNLITAADALRRPERLERLLAAAEAHAQSRSRTPGAYRPAQILRDALAIVKTVDAGAVARESGREADAIAKAIRAARLDALRRWRAAGPR